MQFVYPGFLWALAFISIPIIIHLFNFRRYKRIDFSNVQMLKAIETQSRKSRQLKKWLILVSRILAIACLVLAFSKPYLPKEKTQGRSLPAVYIDNSFSMNAIGEKGQLFYQAKAAARDLLSGLDREAEVLMMSNGSVSSRNILIKSRALEWVDNLEIIPEVNSLSKSIQSAERIAKQENYNQADLYLLSDFQKTSENLAIELDSMSNVHAIALSPLGSNNISIDSVYLGAPLNKSDVPIELMVKLSNHGEQKIENANLVLEINGIQQGTENYSIDAKSSSIVKLSFISSARNWLKGLVKITDPVVNFDNSYYFSMRLKSQFDVLILAEDKSKFSSLFAKDVQFSVDEQSPLNIDYSKIQAYDLIILDQIKDVGSSLSSPLSDFIEKGGILYFVPNSDGGDVPLGLGISPLGSVKTVELSVQADDLLHPFFRGVFSRIPKNSKMPKIHKLFAVQKASSAEVLLQLKDKSPLLLRQAKGKGYVYQLTVPLKDEWSDFYENELFVLSALQAAFSRNQNQDIAYSLTSREAIKVDAVASEEALSLSNTDQRIIVESSAALGKFRFWLNEEFQTAGSYVLHMQSNSDTLGLVSLNYNRAESNQTYYSAEELKQTFNRPIFMHDNKPELLQSLGSSAIGGRSLWKLFVVLCLIFLLIEILLLRFLKS